MALFGFGKKKEENSTACGCSGQGAKSAGCGCGCGGSCGKAAVQILGSGCAKCNELEQATVAALQELGMPTAVEHVTDFAQIAAYGVMTTPALVVNGKVLSFGKVLKKDEIIALLQANAAE